MSKIALIFGLTGQDGAYLARLLLKKNYIVHGVKRRSSSLNTDRIDGIYLDPHQKTNFYIHYGDLTDSLSVLKLIQKVKPNEIYNLGAQSHVGVSFEVPEYTANVDAIGTLRILDSILTLQLSKRIKFYQAGTSEMFGASKPPQNEKTNFYPRSPYAVAKLYAHWITINYREAYNIFACNGILFNHESPIRGETFVTKKIVSGLCKIALTGTGKLYLGNLYSKRDWGHAKEYAYMQWKIIQQKKADDFVIATGRNYSVKYFLEECCKYLEIEVAWSGKGLKEFAYIKNFNKNKFPLLKKNQVIVKIDKRYFRPNDVNNLNGDSRKAKKFLNWTPKYTFQQLVADMLSADLKHVKKSNG